MQLLLKQLRMKMIDLLEVINNVVTDEASNSFLGGTTYAQEQIESAKVKF